MKARSVNNKTPHIEEDKVSLEDFMIKAKRDNKPNDEKNILAPIKIKYAQDERREMYHQQREPWMNRGSHKRNEKGETPIQEINRIMNEQARRSYPNKDRERRKLAKDYTRHHN
jgi:hypothetical protein